MPARSTLRDILRSAGAIVPDRDLRTWTPVEQSAAEKWAYETKLRASGYEGPPVRVPPHVRPFLLEAA